MVNGMQWTWRKDIVQKRSVFLTVSYKDEGKPTDSGKIVSHGKDAEAARKEAVAGIRPMWDL